jgi:uncharacterized membrane protein
MTDPSARTFSADFKRFFLRGLVILLPSVLTLWIVVKAYQFIDSAIAQPINQGVQIGMIRLAPYWEPLRTNFDPDDEQFAIASADPVNKSLSDDEIRAELRSSNIQTWWAGRWYMDLIGLVVAIIAVYVAGRLLGGFLGRRFYSRIERFITSVPILKQVYPSVKQIVDFLFSDERPVKFNRVVAVEYPRKGVWAMGFLTADAFTTIAERAGDCVTVFVPSSPTPFTGYAVCVPRHEVLELPVTVDEAIRFIVSCGVLVPETPSSRPGRGFNGLIPAPVPIPIPQGCDEPGAVVAAATDITRNASTFNQPAPGEA